MATVAVEQAKVDFLRLIDDVANGQQIVITRNNIPVARIIPVVSPKPTPEFGSAKGLFKMEENFDAPIDELQDYSE